MGIMWAFLKLSGINPRTTCTEIHKKKPIFSYAKKISKAHTKICPLLNELNSYTKTYPEMVEILSKQYSSAFTQPSDNPYITCEVKNDIPTLDEIHFTKTDKEDAIDAWSTL